MTTDNKYQQQTAAASSPDNDNAAGASASPAPIRGTSDGETLSSENTRADIADVFDSDAGGNDTLLGGRGNDVYWLGFGTHQDTIHENVDNSEDGDDNDRVKIKSNLTVRDIRLTRSGDDLLIEVTKPDPNSDPSNDPDDAGGNSLTVSKYFSETQERHSSQIEYIEFTDASGTVWDSDDIRAKAAFRDSGSRTLDGTSKDDVFDTDDGNEHTLRGMGGDDVYLLGIGTGRDTIDEAEGNVPGNEDRDKIKIESGIGDRQVRLNRMGNDLAVELVESDGSVQNSLTVKNHYKPGKAEAQIEVIQLSDGTKWRAAEIASHVAFRGTAGKDTLKGTDEADVLDGNAGGKDKLRGRGGNDVYLLGGDTDEDTIQEDKNNSKGDGGDRIRIKSGIVKGEVNLVRVGGNGEDLRVELTGAKAGNSLTVKKYFSKRAARIEYIDFADKDVDVVWDEVDIGRMTAIRGEVGGFGYGSRLDDVYDGSDRGDNTFRDEGGDDVYWLGHATGADKIEEHGSDDGDSIRVDEGITSGQVVLSRVEENGKGLLVEVLNADGAVSGSLLVKDQESAGIESLVFSDEGNTTWDEDEIARRAVLRGGADNDTLRGTDEANEFDGDAGGSDILQGEGGSDKYRLGWNTGEDTVQEYGGMTDAIDEDRVVLDRDVSLGQVQLSRVGANGKDLLIELVGGRGTARNSLTIEGHALVGENNRMQIEWIEFTDADKTTWNEDKIIQQAVIRGGAGADVLTGTDKAEMYDSAGGGADAGRDMDILRGGGGADEYQLGAGTGKDMIQEYFDNDGNDAGDRIKVKSDIGTDGVRLVRVDGNGTDLRVELLGANEGNWLLVENYFSDKSARVEYVEFTDGSGTVWDESAIGLMTAIKGGRTGNTYGSRHDDVFDGSDRGNNIFVDSGGDDVYWLGVATEHDRIREDGGTDTIRVESGIAVERVTLSRVGLNGANLRVEVRDDNDALTASLTVEGYAGVGKAVELIEFSAGAGGAKWDKAFMERNVVIRGSGEADTLVGTDKEDKFDSAGGDGRAADNGDILRGLGGSDEYSLGHGTGADTIEEAAASDDVDKIRIKQGFGVDDVSFRGTTDLIVEVRDGDQVNSLTVKDFYKNAATRIEQVIFSDESVWNLSDIAQRVMIRGSAADAEKLVGTDENDVFDSNAGGDDMLCGGGGDDVYWLGHGTGADTIEDAEAANVIKVKSAVAADRVRFSRVGVDLLDLRVEVVDEAGARTDSLTVKDYYKSGSGAARIDRVELSDDEDVVSQAWREGEIAAEVVIRGSGADGETLDGSGEADRFDGNEGGDDTLRGRGGDDVYFLGHGTGRDTIQEAHENSGGDGNDRIKVKPGIGSDKVQLVRVGGNGADLRVELLNAENEVADWLLVEGYFSDKAAQIEAVDFLDNEGRVTKSLGTAAIGRQTAIKSSGSGQILVGSQWSDVFDDDGGGDNTLRGLGGDDVYWLSHHTGDDKIEEDVGDGRDKIRIAADVLAGRVQLSRVGGDLLDLRVEVVDEVGEQTDSLTVVDYYKAGHGSALIEVIELMDDAGNVGPSWGENEIAADVVIRGSGIGNTLHGTSDNDVFDSDEGGSDTLRGGLGDDEYRLGKGTGADTIQEAHRAVREGDSGDGNDRIRIESGIGESGVRLVRVDGKGADLRVELTGANAGNSLLVEDYFSDKSARIEFIEFTDGDVVWHAHDIGRQTAIRGVGDNALRTGSIYDDVFDGEGTRNNTFYGRGGDDVYWLGDTTHHDRIREESGKDRIRVESGIAVKRVTLSRVGVNGANLRVEVGDDNDEMTASLTVENYETAGKEVELIEFADGKGGLRATWEKAHIERNVVIRGSDDEDTLEGTDKKDVFDSAGGGENDDGDILKGGGGDDVYWLRHGTGRDLIHDTGGNDKISIRPGIAQEDVQLQRVGRDGADLRVELVRDGTVTSSLTVEGYAAAGKAVESIELDGEDSGRATWDKTDIERNSVIRGSDDVDTLVGTSGKDRFDSAGGGENDDGDILKGGGGDDVYWLRHGTGRDLIQDTGGNDSISIRPGIAQEDVQLQRVGRDGADLRVELVRDGTVTSSLTVEGYAAAGKAVESIELDGENSGRTTWDKTDIERNSVIRGSDDVDTLVGTSGKDRFDSAGGGDDDDGDTLKGGAGDDVYWLGHSTGRDLIQEADGDDRISIKSGIVQGNVQLRRVGRDGSDLRVELVRDGAVTSSLTVEDYAGAGKEVERIELDKTDGGREEWDKAVIERKVVIRGSSGADTLVGTDKEDVFDSAGGGDDDHGDTLKGGAGDDVYWLGIGTGKDRIIEAALKGNMRDVIKIKEEVRREVTSGNLRVRVRVDRDDLVVALIDNNEKVTDSLTVEGFYTGRGKRIEQVEWFDGEIIKNEVQLDYLPLEEVPGPPDPLVGTPNDDVFDSVGLSDDNRSYDLLEGGQGNDTYWLGHGTGRDRIAEHADGGNADKIKIKSNVMASRVRLTRDWSNIAVELVDENNQVTDSLTVSESYWPWSSKCEIEYVEFSDGTEWDKDYVLRNAAVRGNSGNDDLYDGRVNGLFDGDAGGDDKLQGRDGDDIYWLGRYTDHDTIQDNYRNEGGGNDGIKIKWDIAESDSSIS